MASVDDSLAAELEAAATDFGMDTLIEIHDAAELERALHLQSPLIGINNRNLKTFALTLDVTRELAPLVPDDRQIVCESGLFSAEDIFQMMQMGARRFLIGESLMRQTDVAAATQAILKVSA